MTWVDKHGLLPGLTRKDTVVLELGPGARKRVADAVGIDLHDGPAVDIVADLDAGLPFLPDASVQTIHAYHFLEHIENLEILVGECHRVLKPGGTLQGSVPHFANPYFSSDYTHRRPFGLYSFSYLSKNPYFRRRVPQFYNAIDFRLQRVDLVFDSPFPGRRPLKKILQCVFNSCRYLREFHEENLCFLFPAYEIRFVLAKPAAVGAPSGPATDRPDAAGAAAVAHAP